MAASLAGNISKVVHYEQGTEHYWSICRRKLVGSGESGVDLLWMSTVMRRLMRSQQSADRCAGMSYCAATMRGNMRFSRVMLRARRVKVQPRGRV